MNFTFHPLAKVELNKAVDYYEEQQVGLGLEFAEEVYSTIERICRFPKAWTPLSKKVRRALTNRFPYGVIYQLHGNSIIIVAIAHLNRKPAYWKTRKN